MPCECNRADGEDIPDVEGIIEEVEGEPKKRALDGVMAGNSGAGDQLMQQSARAWAARARQGD
jgi:hypothetical protein